MCLFLFLYIHLRIYFESKEFPLGFVSVSRSSLDNAFQPTAATPLFLKSSILLPKSIPEEVTAHIPPPAFAAAAGGASSTAKASGVSTPGAAAPGGTAKKQTASSLSSPSGASGGGGGGVSSPAAKSETPSASPSKGPPPGAGAAAKKAAGIKAPGALKKPQFKTSIKAKS